MNPEELKASFTQAANDAQNLAQRPTNETLLKLYGLYKQATVGDATGKRPGFTDPVNRAKFDAWSKLKGASAESAMQAYVRLVNDLRT